MPSNPSRTPPAMHTPWQSARACAAATGLALVVAGAWAGPIDRDGALAGPDPYELAARWTVANLAPAIGAGAAAPLWGLHSGLPPALRETLSTAHPAGAAPAPALPRFTALPVSTAGAEPPGPGAYALVGLLLLAAGLALPCARRARTAQRGFSKKT